MDVMSQHSSSSKVKLMLTLDEERHVYMDGGVELPSVTTITRFCSMDSRTAAGANPFYRERGTLVHALCADYDYTGDEDSGTGVDGYLRAYYDFCRDYRPHWERVEQPVGGTMYGVAGTIDRAGAVNGTSVIVDLKTSSKLNVLAVTAQLTGYWVLTDMAADALFALQLMKNGKYRFVPIAPDMELWQSCLTLHQKGEKACQKKSS